MRLSEAVVGGIVTIAPNSDENEARR